MDTKDLLIQAIKDAVAKAIAEQALPEGQLPTVILEVPPKKELGDFASNIAMQSARVFHVAPRKIAEEIVSRFSMDLTFILTFNESKENQVTKITKFFLKKPNYYFLNQTSGSSG